MKAALLFLLAASLAHAGESIHWPFEDAADPAFALHGNADAVTGVAGKALALDGHSLIEIADSAARGHGEPGFSVVLWVNAFAPGNGRQQMLAAKNRYSHDERQWGAMLDRDGRFRLYVWQDGWKTVEHPAPPQAGHWHQVGVVMRPGAAELWVDGALSGQLALGEPVPHTEAPLTFGGVHDSGARRQTFFGALDEVRFFDEALSAAAMAALHRPVDATLPVPAHVPAVLSALWDEAKPLPKAAELPVVEGARFSIIKPYEFDKDGYRFLHGVALCFHRGKLYASFGHNQGGENTDTEEARYCVSEDGGRTWSEVRTIDSGEPGLGVSHGSFLSRDGALWAFMGAYRGIMQGVHTRAYVLDEATGEWQAKGTVAEDGFWPMQEPLPMDDGNWIMAGLQVGGGNPAAVAISRGDDFAQWDVVAIPAPEGIRMWGESTVIVEGAHIANISRYGGEARALSATSEDYGRTWTTMQPANLPMATSKPYAGTLSTGQRYLVCTTTADSGGRRAPLTIAVSTPGQPLFNKAFVVRHALFPGGPGESHERVSLSYPYAIEHDGHLYIGYSNNGGHVGRVGKGRELWNNNSAELAVVPLGALKVE